MSNYNNRGITLVALIITIVVIIIIASIGATIGRNLIDKSKVENLTTNMLIIKSKAKVFEEEVESKTWNFSDTCEEGSTISKKEEGRRDHFKNEYNFTLIDNSNSSTFGISSLESDSVYYALGEEALKNMGVASLLEDGKSYYVVKYTVKDNKYDDIDIYYTKGVKYEKNKYYALSELQEILNI